MWFAKFVTKNFNSNITGNDFLNQLKKQIIGDE